MNSSRIINSRIFKFFDYIFRLVLINMLIIIPSFLLIYLPGLLFKKIIPNNYQFVIYLPLIFYLFPALIAGTDCIRQYEMKLTKNVFKPFFKCLKTNYIKGLIDGIIIFAVGFILLNSLMYFYHHLNNGNIFLFGMVLCISFILIFLMIVFHLPLVMVYFEGCKFYEDIKLACIMAFSNIIKTILIILLSAILIYLSFSGIQILMVTLASSLPIYLMIKFHFRQYFLVYIKTHKEEDINQ